MKKVAFGLLLSVVLSACSQTVDTPTIESKSISIEPSQICSLSPLTNNCFEPTNPVLAVKIDDVSAARPQYELNAADVVVVEPVEAGLTRLMAIYNSIFPEIVGPVRSARITDLDLATAFGQPGFAYSGSTSKLVPYLSDSNLQLVGAPQGGTGYFRDDTRPAPHNYLAYSSELIARIADPTSAALNSSQYWSFGDWTSLGKAPASIEVVWASSSKTFIWDPDRMAWQIEADGAQTQSLQSDGSLEPALATTVFIQETQLLDSPFVFSNGVITPYAQTVGTGKGWLLTRGQVFYIDWLRPLTTDLPIWFDKTGAQIPLETGNLWWLIAPRDDTAVNLVFPQSASASPAVNAQTP